MSAPHGKAWEQVRDEYMARRPLPKFTLWERCLIVGVVLGCPAVVIGALVWRWVK